MTYRERAAIEHPDRIGSYPGGVIGCPSNYGYTDATSCPGVSAQNCKTCWSRAAQPRKVRVRKKTKNRFQPSEAVEIGEERRSVFVSRGARHHGEKETGGSDEERGERRDGNGR